MPFAHLQEAILFLQRLASLARNGWTRGPLQGRWEATFLDMIHTLCTSHNLPQARPAMCCREPVLVSILPPCLNALGLVIFGS